MKRLPSRTVLARVVLSTTMMAMACTLSAALAAGSAVGGDAATASHREDGRIQDRTAPCDGRQYRQVALSEDGKWVKEGSSGYTRKTYSAKPHAKAPSSHTNSFGKNRPNSRSNDGQAILVFAVIAFIVLLLVVAVAAASSKSKEGGGGFFFCGCGGGGCGGGCGGCGGCGG